MIFWSGRQGRRRKMAGRGGVLLVVPLVQAGKETGSHVSLTSVSEDWKGDCHAGSLLLFDRGLMGSFCTGG